MSIYLSVLLLVLLANVCLNAWLMVCMSNHLYDFHFTSLFTSLSVSNHSYLPIFPPNYLSGFHRLPACLLAAMDASLTLHLTVSKPLVSPLFTLLTLLFSPMHESLRWSANPGAERGKLLPPAPREETRTDDFQEGSGDEATTVLLREAYVWSFNHCPSVLFFVLGI